MRKYGILALFIVLFTGILGYLYSIWPITYEDKGMKIVEYRSGQACMYMKFDNWNQMPIICMPVSEMRKTHPKK